MQWWGALTQQFQTIAGNALKDAAKQLMRAQGRVQHILSNIIRDFRRTDMFRQPVRIFRIEIVKAAAGGRLGRLSQSG